MLPTRTRPREKLFPPSKLDLYNLRRKTRTRPRPPRRRQRHPPKTKETNLLQNSKTSTRISPRRQHHTKGRKPTKQPLQPTHKVPRFPPSPPLLPCRCKMCHRRHDPLRRSTKQDHNTTTPQRMFKGRKPLSRLCF